MWYYVIFFLFFLWGCEFHSSACHWNSRYDPKTHYQSTKARHDREEAKKALEEKSTKAGAIECGKEPQIKQEPMVDIHRDSVQLTSSQSSISIPVVNLTNIAPLNGDGGDDDSVVDGNDDDDVLNDMDWAITTPRGNIFGISTDTSENADKFSLMNICGDEFTLF